jgi:hypothetical protein
MIQEKNTLNTIGSTRTSDLPIEVPPMLEDALGYMGEARFVAFFFDASDEVYYADGRVTTCGDWDAYELFVHHPLIAPHVCGYHLGSAKEPPTHYLLLDRNNRTLLVASVVNAQRLLCEQWQPVQSWPELVLVASEEEGEQLVQELMTCLPHPSLSQGREQWQGYRSQVEALAAWLAEQKVTA